MAQAATTVTLQVFNLWKQEPEFHFKETTKKVGGAGLGFQKSDPDCPLCRQRTYFEDLRCKVNSLFKVSGDQIHKMHTIFIGGKIVSSNGCEFFPVPVRIASIRAFIL